MKKAMDKVSASFMPKQTAANAARRKINEALAENHRNAFSCGRAGGVELLELINVLRDNSDTATKSANESANSAPSANG
jgi:hypothetical protein